MTVFRSKCGLMELRLGSFRDVLRDVRADTCATDPPYSERTHNGHDASTKQRKQIRGQTYRPIDYAWWDESDVNRFYQWIDASVRGWAFAFTDDWLTNAYRAEAEARGRYSFPPVAWLAHRPRLMGDGPTNNLCHGMASRPRTTEFSRWGCLPGEYRVPQDADAIPGGKPLALMRAIVRDYSKPGDLVVDPCAGRGTTLRAAAIEGRRAIGAEIDPETFELAVQYLSKPYTVSRVWMPGDTSGRQEGLDL